MGAKSLSGRPQAAACARTHAISAVSSKDHAIWLHQRRIARMSCFDDDEACVALTIKCLSISISIFLGEIIFPAAEVRMAAVLLELSVLRAHTPGARILALPSFPRFTRMQCSFSLSHRLQRSSSPTDATSHLIFEILHAWQVRLSAAGLFLIIAAAGRVGITRQASFSSSLQQEGSGLLVPQAMFVPTVSKHAV